MRWKKTRDEDKLKVIEAKLRDPQKSLRDIESETWTNYKVAWDIINNIWWVVTGCNRDKEMCDKIDTILDDIIDITALSMSWYREKAMEQKLKTWELRDLSAIAKDNFDRKQLLNNKPTSIDKKQIDLSTATLEELQEIRRKFLWHD